MLFNHIIGNEPVKKHLYSMWKKKRIGQSLLFSGPDGIGKSLFAISFAKFLLEIPSEKQYHPDLHLFFPQGKMGMHSIERMREFSEEIYLPPMETNRKVFILFDADRMLSYSANALLKTFEEPPLDTVIILVSSHHQKILPTILSRCFYVPFSPLNEEEIREFLEKKFHIEKSTAIEASSSASGSLKTALRMIDPAFQKIKKELFDFLEKANFESYSTCRLVVELITKELEEKMKGWEEEWEKSKEGLEILKQQMDSLEKEYQGNLALLKRQELDLIIKVIISWCKKKDRELMSKNSFLPASSFFLFQLQDLCTSLYQSFEKSTPLPICLENLLIQLCLLKK